MQVSATPSVTLSEVLHLALPAGSRLRWGDLQLAGRVHWARVLRTRPTGRAGVEPGELPIMSGALFSSPSDARVLTRLVEELADAGAVAFLYVGEAPEWLVVACEASRAPLLETPVGTPPELERAIIGLILDRDGQLRRRAEEVYERLLATMLGNAGLPALLQTLAVATGLRAAVFDDYLALQASAPDDASFRQLLVEAAGTVLAREAGSTGRAGRPLSFGLSEDGSAWSGHLYPLQIGETLAGYLGLLGEVGEPGDLDRLLADRVSTLVAIELAKERSVAEAMQRGRGELLDDLLDGNFPTAEAALTRAQQLGYDLLSRHLVFVLGVDGAGIGDGQLGIARQRRRFGELARSTLARQEARALVVEREGTLVAMVPFGQGEAEATAAVERVRSAVADAVPGVGVSAGVGRVVRQPSDFGEAYREARQALRIARQLLGGGRAVHYRQVGIERLLVLLLGNPELERFALDTLGGLLAYDLQHRGELVHTVDVFLRCNGNHVRAAAELHLHRNTLLYRLERAREILGCDFEDADTRLALQVALRIRGTISEGAVESEQPVRRGARRRRAG